MDGHKLIKSSAIFSYSTIFVIGIFQVLDIFNLSTTGGLFSITDYYYLIFISVMFFYAIHDNVKSYIWWSASLVSLNSVCLVINFVLHGEGTVNAIVHSLYLSIIPFFTPLLFAAALYPREKWTNSEHPIRECRREKPAWVSLLVVIAVLIIQASNALPLRSIQGGDAGVYFFYLVFLVFLLSVANVKVKRYWAWCLALILANAVGICIYMTWQISLGQVAPIPMLQFVLLKSVEPFVPVLFFGLFYPIPTQKPI